MKTKEKNITVAKDQEYYVRRLHVIEGQVRGLANMVENERTYEEVLMQLGALTNSLRTVGRSILESYMRNNLNDTDKSKIDEIIKLFNKLV